MKNRIKKKLIRVTHYQTLIECHIRVEEVYLSLITLHLLASLPNPNINTNCQYFTKMIHKILLKYAHKF